MPDRYSSGDRSIRNVPVIGNHRRPPTPPPDRYRDDFDESDEPVRRPRLPRRRMGRRVLFLLIGAALVCGALGFLLSTVFEGATVTITPKTAAVSVPATVVVQPNAPTGYLAYQTITATQTASTSVVANGSQQVSRAATGVVTIYNTYSAAPQTLVANTRFSTQDGKIYRLKDAVTVPGTTKKSDGTTAPGTVAVSIFADKPGPAYNQADSVPMNIVGFKGDPRYTKFVAQSQGSIQNGFIGSEPAIAPNDMATAQDELKRQLDSSIRSIATSQIPDGFISVNGSLGVTYTDITQVAGSNNTVVLSQGASATLAMVRDTDLAATLAKTLPGYANEPIQFADASSVTLSLSTGSASSTGPLSLSVTGTPTLVWQFDQTGLKQQLLGKKKSVFPSVIRGFEPAIVTASATMRPFWKATFPSDPNKIRIIVTQ